MIIEHAIQQKKFENEHHKLFLNIIYTANRFDALAKKVFTNFDITNTQYNILRILAGASPKPLSAGEIKKVMISKNCDVTRLLDRLTAKSLVERIICPDNRRKMNITITKNGVKLLEKIKPKLEEGTQEYQKKMLTKSEAKILNELLDKLNKTFS